MKISQIQSYEYNEGPLYTWNVKLTTVDGQVLEANKTPNENAACTRPLIASGEFKRIPVGRCGWLFTR